MVQSMTGFAAYSMESKGYQISVEVKSVNNRFFNLSYRCTNGLDKFEDWARTIVQKYVTRGSVSLFLKVKSIVADGQVKLNREMLENILQQMDDIALQTKVSRNISFDTIFKVPGIFVETRQEESQVPEELKESLQISLQSALKAFVLMRENEGARLVSAIQLSLLEIEAVESKLRVAANNIEKELMEEYQQKLNKLLSSVKSDISFESKDILKEVVLLIEKVDIQEEINRIKSHIAEVKKTLAEGGLIGKKLDFLSQELNREFNTICSKTKKIEISQLAINGKLEVEKIKEQVQNLE